MILIKLLRKYRTVSIDPYLSLRTSKNCLFPIGLKNRLNSKLCGTVRVLSTDKGNDKSPNNSISSKEPLKDYNLNASSSNGDEFITIYVNPAAKYFAVLNLALKYPCIAAAAGIPISSILYAIDYISCDKLKGILFFCTWISAVINLVACNSWRKIGFMYVNKDSTKLKISYISYWGKRIDVILPITNVMSFSDMHRSPFDFFYRKVKTFDSKWYRLDAYKLEYRGTTIVKPDVFENIFGSLK